MKTTVYFAIISFILLFSSCTEGPQLNPQGNTDYSVKRLAKYDESELNMVYSALDSLNQSLICRNRVSRGFPKKFMVQLADQAGRRGGQWIGRTAGASIGSLGGPGTACVGYLAGNLIGGILGDAAASAFVDCLLDCHGYTMVAPNAMMFKADYGIKVAAFIELAVLDSMYMDQNSNIMPLDFIGNTGDNGGTVSNNPSLMISQYVLHDSLGYYHNSFMVSVNHNKNTYILNGKPNIDRLYDDVLLSLMVSGYDINSFKNDPELRHLMIEMIQSFGELGYRGVVDGMSLDQYVEAQCDYLQSNCLLTDEEISIYKNFDVKVVEACSALSEEDIHEYSAALNDLLSSAEISHELRINLAIGAQAAINSALCWNQ